MSYIYANECSNERTNVCTNVRTNECTNVRTNVRTIDLLINVIGEDNTILGSETVTDQIEITNNCISSDILIRKISDHQRNLGADYAFMIRYDPGCNKSVVSEFNSPPLNDVMFTTPTQIDTSMIVIVLNRTLRDRRRANIKTKSRREKNKYRVSGNASSTRRNVC